MIRVLIADDHPIVRQGLLAALAETDDIRVMAEAGQGSDAIEHARTGQFDVIVLDISMPGMNGFDVLKLLLAEHPQTRVLILSTYPEKQYAIRCLKAGAMGYLTKESAASELATAIRRVANGRKYVSASLAERLADQVDIDPTRPLHDALSDREFQVMCFLGKGKTVSEIAEMLSLSVPTIHTYRARVLDKMKMESTAQLMLYVLENKLTDEL
jgi:two-component system invasion response regulator UvrY